MLKGNKERVPVYDDNRSSWPWEDFDSEDCTPKSEMFGYYLKCKHGQEFEGHPRADLLKNY